MWKRVGGALLCCGAIYSIFGVLGIAFYLIKWSRPALRHADPHAGELGAP